ncbi:helix-turn-helix domain-containing protein [Amycolatopsis sp. NPDC051758]|uniref:MmyB family transcriptional regulator n=1 Tax=Amycolatopsis sp. NPDC051758 TaxID=3363935 RepID=UPI0037A942B1
MATPPDPVIAPVDPRAELSEFLRSRRARLQPSDVGLPEYGRRRRVPGLRREELAQLAGVSVAYYTRLEQGNGRNVSLEVLNAISSALKLSETEHAHLLHLTKPGPRRRSAPQRQHVRPVLLQMLSAMESVPAYVWGRRTDVLAWNRTASALFGDWAARDPRDRNWARIVFLDPASRDLFPDWRRKAADVVGQLRLDSGRHPDDPLLAELVGELSVKSDDFRTMWAAHDVKRKTHDTMRLQHPLVGPLTVHYETFSLPGDQDQALSIYHAEPASPSEEALRLLASWGTDAAWVGSGGSGGSPFPSHESEAFHAHHHPRGALRRAGDHGAVGEENS